MSLVAPPAAANSALTSSEQAESHTVLESSDEEEIQPGGTRALGARSSVSPLSGSKINTRHRGASGTVLGFHFNGGQASGSGARQPLSWREGHFSDWTVHVGENTYHLHAFLLARASLYFGSHMDSAARVEGRDGSAPKRCSDLTEVLPRSCHAAFEDALDFIYSENQAAFEAPGSKALLLLKVADILGIGKLFDAMGRRIEATFSEMAPLLMEQYCQVHVPGTDDGTALRQIRDSAVELIVRKFQPFLAVPEMLSALLQLPGSVLAEILEADDLVVANEDVVLDFVMERLEASAGTSGKSTGSSLSISNPQDVMADNEAMWQRIRWAHLSAAAFSQAVSVGQRHLKPEVVLYALMSRVSRLDLCGLDGVEPAPPRHPILPPGVPPPTSTEIDFCFHYTRTEEFACGEALRSFPKRIGDLVLRLFVFPAGTDTGVAKGSLSVFLEAVPQPHWPVDWEFANIRYAIACLRWPTGSGETWAAKRKSDLWTFKANRLDRGWHDFLAPGEVHRYLGPDGFICLRSSVEPECLARTFILNSHVGHNGSLAHSGEAAGSSASRRSWAPRATAPAGPDSL